MSSSAQDPIPQLDLGKTFGALFIGVILAAVLFGLTNVQAFIYLQAHRSAGITFLSWLYVHTALIFDALHLALTIHCVYYYLVTNYANFGVLTEIVWSLKVSFYNGPLCSLCFCSLRSTQQYALHRFSSFLWYICKFSDCYCNIQVMSWSTWMTYLSLGTATFIDILIASSLCYLLATSRTGFSSICSMSIIIACAVMPTTFIFIGLQFLVTKLYVNSFIAFLNARYYMQANAIVNPPQFYERHGVYHQELHTSGSQDEEFHKSRGDPKDEVLHITQPIQGIMVSGCVMVDGRGLIDTP
ncbi:hypothetical protein BDR06DRAFT_1037593 [Suillus hirtellus]|nr:hypothetical protein BDR06DRAFT_1037593 [Suillus hirtellus]